MLEQWLQLAVMDSSLVALAYRPLNVLVLHAVTTILLRAKTACFTPASTLHYYNILNLATVTIKFTKFCEHLTKPE